MYLAASFFASSVLPSQYVKWRRRQRRGSGGKHLLSNVPKKRKQMHTHAHTLTHTRLRFPCAAFILQHHNATLNMVRTSFLKLIKAVKLYCSLLKQMPGEEPRDDTSTHPPPLRLSFFSFFFAALQKAHVSLPSARRRCRRDE